jgi:RNA polymerase sigma-70 factor (ECF subfamily)
MTDAARFEAFVREYQDMVYGTAVRMLGNPAEAEDVAQTVFLRAFERFGVLGRSPTAAGWLKTVTTNLCLNHLTRYRRRWQFFSELDGAGPAPEGTSFADTLPAAVPTALDDIAQLDRCARLEDALQHLPPHQRVPLVLFHFDEMSYEQIATRLRISLGKVKTDIHRGRQALRAALAAGRAGDAAR